MTDRAPMLLDSLLPDFDATRIEHRVVPGTATDVYPIAIEVDFIEAVRRSQAVRALFGMRGALEKIVATLRGTNGSSETAEAESLRLNALPSQGEWVLLGDDPPREIAFGSIGRFWSGETSWERISSPEFAAFATPGFAKIGCNLSLRPYGTERTLVSYEARTKATDEAARRAFLRYWHIVSPLVGVVMRSTLAVISDQVATRRAAVS